MRGIRELRTYVSTGREEKEVRKDYFRPGAMSPMSSNDVALSRLA